MLRSLLLDGLAAVDVDDDPLAADEAGECKKSRIGWCVAPPSNDERGGAPLPPSLSFSHLPFPPSPPSVPHSCVWKSHCDEDDNDSSLDRARTGDDGVRGALLGWGEAHESCSGRSGSASALSSLSS